MTVDPIALHKEKYCNLLFVYLNYSIWKKLNNELNSP
jgi:hypothetical protein